MKQFSSNCMSRNPGPHWSVQPLIGRETFRFFVENPEIAWLKSRQNFQTTNRAAKCRPTFEYRHATQIPRISVRERSISTSKPSSARPKAAREGSLAFRCFELGSTVFWRAIRGSRWHSVARDRAVKYRLKEQVQDFLWKSNSSKVFGSESPELPKSEHVEKKSRKHPKKNYQT